MVLGHPLNMDGTAGFMAERVEVFARRLRSDFGLPVHLIDERLSSYEAESTVAPSAAAARGPAAWWTSRSATLVLQDFLNSRLGLL